MDIEFLSSTMVTLLKALPMTLALFALSVSIGCVLALVIVWMRVGGNRYLAGFFGINDSVLYVNSGIGSSSVPIRAGAPSEVAIITLRSVQ